MLLSSSFPSFPFARSPVFVTVYAIIFKAQKYLLFGYLCTEYIAVLVATIASSPVHPPLLPVGHGLAATESEAWKRPATSYQKTDSKILVNPRLKNCQIDCLLPFLVLQCFATQRPAPECLI